MRSILITYFKIATQLPHPTAPLFPLLYFAPLYSSFSSIILIMLYCYVNYVILHYIIFSVLFSDIF